MNSGGSQPAGRGPLHKHNQPKTLGFTILEVLIVLAVSALLFFIVAVVINGRQNKTEFQTAINTVPQQLQQIINETASGYFPSLSNFSCQIQADGSLTFPVGGSAPQGTNQGCVFLGKAVQFGLSSGGSYDIYPIAGNRVANAVQGAYGATPSGAQPTPVVALKQSQNLLYGLHISWMKYTPQAGGAGTTTGAVGFLAGGPNGVFSSSDGTGYLTPNSQQLGLYAVGDPSSGGTPTDISTSSSVMVADLSAPSGTKLIPASSVTMCFVSGGTNQSGVVTIGAAGGLGVSLQVKENSTCS